MSDGCQPFDLAPPAAALFDPKKTVIVSNGRCASSCALFSITMAKEEGAKTVVYGGKKGVQQEYCGTVGGQSTDFSTIDTEIKVRLSSCASLGVGSGDWGADAWCVLMGRNGNSRRI